jgi:hypothetical protein
MGKTLFRVFTTRKPSLISATPIASLILSYNCVYLYWYHAQNGVVARSRTHNNDVDDRPIW